MSLSCYCTMSLTIDSQLSSAKYRDASQECYPNGYMTPPSSATSRRPSVAMSADSFGPFSSTSFPASESNSFCELLTPTSSFSASSHRRHSTAYSDFQPCLVADPSIVDSRHYIEASTPSDWPQSSTTECFVLDTSYTCATSSSSFSNDLRFGSPNEEGLLMTMPGDLSEASAPSVAQDLQGGHILSYNQTTSLATDDMPGFDPMTTLDTAFLSSAADYGDDCIALKSTNDNSWPANLALSETVVPSHMFMLSSPPGSPLPHHLGSPIKLEQMNSERASFDNLSAYSGASPGSSPTTSGRRLLDITVTPTPRNRGLGRFRKLGRLSGWKSGNKAALRFPGCDIRKIESIETNPCVPCTVILDKHIAFKRPEHLKRHLITEQHTKNVAAYAMRMKLECPTPVEKPIYPCLIPNCKKGLDKSPFVGRRDNLTQHYKNTHFHDKHRNGGGKNDWISVERADELGLASKDPRNEAKYEG